MRRAAPSALLLLALLAPSVRGEPGPAEPSPSSLTDAERPALGPALRAIERGHYATAVRALKRPAQRGDPLAQNNLG